MYKPALIAVSTLCWFQVVAAQERGAPADAAAVRKAWSEYQAAEASYHAAAAEARRGLETGNRGDRNEARARYLAAVEGPQREMMTQQSAFFRAMASCGIDEFDVEADRQLLIEGLPGAAQEAIDADPVRAIALYEALLSYYPDSDAARAARSRGLWKAQVAAGRTAAAIEVYRGFAKRAEGVEALGLRMVVGDLQAITGDTERARQTWKELLTEVPGDADRAGQRVKSDAEFRLALVGRPAPEIDSDTWIGGDAAKLSSYRGRVVVVDFWATWCGPCRAVMPGLSQLYQARREAGLDVLGVTRFYANGYLPANAEQMRSGGESVEKMDTGSFRQHLVDFRRNTGIAYPFVIGSQPDFEAYHVSGIPTLAIIDRSGVVAMAIVGSGQEMVVRAVVDRLLRE